MMPPDRMAQPGPSRMMQADTSDDEVLARNAGWPEAGTAVSVNSTM